jgi:hypothetical protein
MKLIKTRKKIVVERGKIAIFVHFCAQKYLPNTFTSLVLWPAMLAFV